MHAYHLVAKEQRRCVARFVFEPNGFYFDRTAFSSLSIDLNPQIRFTGDRFEEGQGPSLA